ncbi:hypothetical protein KFK09_000731 [Dendrobium nobile]|uniref:RING-CH-type domain-containing protein n=1 Tax=Dendrobium nobile TaxID=94219 RepID=A0A8T3C9F0_DENNO|nr:hypothetical protein KFK09_000731 [Dendrobium nobile]
MDSGSGKDGEAAESSSHKEEIKHVSAKSEASVRDACVVIDVDRIGRSLEGAEDTCRVNEEERMCRVCHLASDCTSQSGVLIQLGCSCKNDLGTAHRFCAERWFATRGNRYCEICGAVAENVTIVGSRSFMLEINDVQSSVFTNRFIARYGLLCNYLGALVVVALLVHWFFHVRLVRGKN